MKMYYQNVHGMYQPQYQHVDVSRDIKNICHRYQDFYVVGQMADGTQMEGIIQDIDEDEVTMLVPETVDEDGMADHRVFVGVGGFPGYGGFGRRRFRRFRRRRFPFYAFTFPYFVPYPFYF
jgi:hypothetical protein